MQALRDELNDEDEAVRLNAAYALGSIGETCDTDMLIEALRQESKNRLESKHRSRGLSPIRVNLIPSMDWLLWVNLPCLH